MQHMSMENRMDPFMEHDELICRRLLRFYNYYLWRRSEREMRRRFSISFFLCLPTSWFSTNFFPAFVARILSGISKGDLTGSNHLCIGERAERRKQGFEHANVGRVLTITVVTSEPYWFVILFFRNNYINNIQNYVFIILRSTFNFFLTNNFMNF